MRRMRRLLVPTVIAAAGAALLSAGPAGAGAGVEPGSITCHGGSLSAAFNPGVTFRKQTTQVQADGDLGVCFSQEHPKLTGGTFRFTGSGTGACPGPFVVGYGRLTITWNDGSTSTMPQMSIRAEARTVALDSGAVSEGPFRGETGRLNGSVTTSLTELGQHCVSSGGLTRYEANLDSVALGAI